jgi:hypothetical protein
LERKVNMAAAALEWALATAGADGAVRIWHPARAGTEGGAPLAAAQEIVPHNGFPVNEVAWNVNNQVREPAPSRARVRGARSPRRAQIPRLTR